MSSYYLFKIFINNLFLIYNIIPINLLLIIKLFNKLRSIRIKLRIFYRHNILYTWCKNECHHQTIKLTHIKYYGFLYWNVE